MDIDKIKIQLQKIIEKSLKELKSLDYEMLTAGELIKVIEGCIRLEKILAKTIGDNEDELTEIWKEIQAENNFKKLKSGGNKK